MPSFSVERPPADGAPVSLPRRREVIHRPSELRCRRRIPPAALGLANEYSRSDENAQLLLGPGSRALQRDAQLLDAEGPITRAPEQQQ
jgi:hypothetical protein